MHFSFFGQSRSTVSSAEVPIEVLTSSATTPLESGIVIIVILLFSGLGRNTVSSAEVPTEVLTPSAIVPPQSGVIAIVIVVVSLGFHFCLIEVYLTEVSTTSAIVRPESGIIIILFLVVLFYSLDSVFSGLSGSTLSSAMVATEVLTSSATIPFESGIVISNSCGIIILMD